MSSVKRLVYAVIHFLREQSQMDTFTPDEQESLEGKQQMYFPVFLFIYMCVCMYIVPAQMFNSFMYNNKKIFYV